MIQVNHINFIFTIIEIIIIKNQAKVIHFSLNDEHHDEISEASSIEELIESLKLMHIPSKGRKEERKKRRLKTKLEEDRE